MQMKKARNARMIFAFMVPLTLIAFWTAHATNPNLIKIDSLDIYDTVSKTFEAREEQPCAAPLMMKHEQSPGVRTNEVILCSFY